MECAIPDLQLDEGYDGLMEAFRTQNYWVKFFMRPCCPPPGESTARNLIDHLKTDIDARDDFSEGEKGALKAIADERLAWYLALPLRRTA